VLPEVLKDKFIGELGLTVYDANVLCEDKDLANYFQDSLSGGISPKALANWLLGPVKSILNESAQEWNTVKVDAGTWFRLQQLADDGKLSFSVAAHKLLPLLLDGKERNPAELAAKNNLLQDAGADDIQLWVTEVLESMPDKVQEYRKGKKGLIGLFMGEVKKRSKGKADPKQTNDILLEKLNKS
jgi:aspartyl-tRNA(Asn)/glutamyl-tRNA(Gln) amidotransferase subunit B